MSFAAAQAHHLPMLTKKLILARSDIMAHYLTEIMRLWNKNRLMDPNAWFAVNAVTYATIMATAQQELTELAAVSIDAQLLDQGYEGKLHGTVNPEALVGVTGDGRPIMGLAYAAVSAVTAFKDNPATKDQPLWQQWQHAYERLLIYSQTALSDTSRQAKAIQMLNRPGTGWIRMVNPPCCARCAILAGKQAQSPTVGFQRHPGCDCDAIPIHDYRNRFNDPTLKNWRFDTREYFLELPEKEQNRIFTTAGAQAIRDGADPTQVVNARRGMLTANGSKPKFTTEGTTRRGQASQYLREQYDRMLLKQPGARSRLMPEEIYRLAGDDHDVALGLLHANGYLTDASPDLSGKWSWAFRDAEVSAAKLRATERLAELGVTGGPPQVKPPSIKVFGGGDDDEAWKEYLKLTKNLDPTVPIGHVTQAPRMRGKQKTISGSHLFEHRAEVARLVREEDATILTDWKTFFPKIKHPEHNIEDWLASGVVNEVIKDPEVLITQGNFGLAAGKNTVLPDGRKIMLAVMLAKGKQRSAFDSKITTIYPMWGQGISGVNKTGEIKLLWKEREV